LRVGTATKELLESKSNTVTGVEVEIDFDDMTVVISFIKVENNKYLGIVKRTVEMMLPCHLNISLKYERINRGELKDTI
jgi:hypothetical protein